MKIHFKYDKNFPKYAVNSKGLDEFSLIKEIIVSLMVWSIDNEDK